MDRPKHEPLIPANKAIFLEAFDEYINAPDDPPEWLCDFCGGPLPAETTTSYCDDECLHLDTHSYGNPS